MTHKYHFVCMKVIAVPCSMLSNCFLVVMAHYYQMKQSLEFVTAMQWLRCSLYASVYLSINLFISYHSHMSCGILLIEMWLCSGGSRAENKVVPGKNK